MIQRFASSLASFDCFSVAYHLASRNNNCCEIKVRDIRDISAMQSASGAENKERRKEPGAREGVSTNRYRMYMYIIKYRQLAFSTRKQVPSEQTQRQRSAIKIVGVARSPLREKERNS